MDRPAIARWRQLAGLGVACWACLPQPTNLAGKACDKDHPCGPLLVCVVGTCWNEGDLPPAPDAGPPPPDGDGGNPAQADGGGKPSDGGKPNDGGTDGGTTSATEVLCADGLDDDGNGLVDCADPACRFRPCVAGSQASVCCGSGADASCIDITTNSQNCGACGVPCDTGRNCAPITVGGFLSGQCGCSGDPDCPQPHIGGLTEDQNCYSGRCECDTVVECGTAQHCTRQEGHSGPGVCHY